MADLGGEEEVRFGFGEELVALRRRQEMEGGNDGGNAAHGQGQGQGGLDVGAAAAKIEGWVRGIGIGGLKMAVGGTPGLRGVGAAGSATGGTGRGDLIELLDGAGSDDGRGFEPSVKMNSSSKKGAKGD